mmetsp:Transcript_47266/g.92190  ORF Transcript_47266/g.92190 Transcript_47266/m.92190 type:complete len:447 (+) Transcript_47266:234-1574(+)
MYNSQQFKLDSSFESSLLIDHNRNLLSHHNELLGGSNNLSPPEFSQNFLNASGVSYMAGNISNNILQYSFSHESQACHADCLLQNTRADTVPTKRMNVNSREILSNPTGCSPYHNNSYPLSQSLNLQQSSYQIINDDNHLANQVSTNYPPMMSRDTDNTTSTDTMNNNYDSSKLGESDNTLTRNLLGGNFVDNFPEKLYRLLMETAKDGKSDVISFLSHGRAFALHKQQNFIKEIAPKYFRFSKLPSFQRQLNLYGFQKINRGADAGAYYHVNFLRGKPGLCIQMKRTKLKAGCTQNVDSIQSPPDTPNFYAMPAVDVDTTHSSCRGVVKTSEYIPVEHQPINPSISRSRFVNSPYVDANSMPPTLDDLTILTEHSIQRSKMSELSCRNNLSRGVFMVPNGHVIRDQGSIFVNPGAVQSTNTNELISSLLRQRQQQMLDVFSSHQI